MSLSEHALCTGVIRKVRLTLVILLESHLPTNALVQNGVKIFEGTSLPVTCERDVFRYLELEYKEPIDRDWD